MPPNGELPVSLYGPMTMLGHFALPTKEDVPVEVIRAKHAGVCYGVERALDMANAAMLDDEATYTLGPLIHNPKVVEELDANGVHVAASPDDVQEGIVIIRSHGVEPDVLATLRERGLTVIDATCPHVAKAQRSAAQLRDMGGTVVVVGRADHPEVLGLCGHAGERAVVVANANELPDELIEPVGVVVQTTQSTEKLESVVEAIRARGIEPTVKNTICFATRQRQESAARLAGEVDAIVIVGGKNSSNTTHLYEICKAHCPKSHFVEGADELDDSWFEGCKTVGVTAGASTPADQIQEVVECLEAM